MKNIERILLGGIILIIVFTLTVLVSQNYVKESYDNKLVGYNNKKYAPYDFKSYKKHKTIHPKNDLIPPSDKFSEYNFPPQKHVAGGMKESKIIDGSRNFPSVDGVSSEFKSLNMFAFNEKKPSCCGQSQYFGSGGCYCITNKQKKYLNNNGVL
jgi:hypothetical protein